MHGIDACLGAQFTEEQPLYAFVQKRKAYFGRSIGYSISPDRVLLCLPLLALRQRVGHHVLTFAGLIIIAGANYGQGSSREHAAITPRFLGLRAVLDVSFAHIHWQNLANFGVLALEFADATDHGRIRRDDVLVLEGIREALATKTEITVHNKTRNENYATRQNFSQRQIDMLLACGLISWLQ